MQLGLDGVPAGGIVSTHGDNSEVMSRCEGRLRSDGVEVRVWQPSWRGDAHAGRVETSLMPRLRDLGVRAATANGEPAGASAEDGRRLLETAIDQLVGMLESSTMSAFETYAERASCDASCA
jgi:creatinine amidohydrolase/Fe(II)-dependent formamide hydrolase-like protein